MLILEAGSMRKGSEISSQDWGLLSQAQYFPASKGVTKEKFLAKKKPQWLSIES